LALAAQQAAQEQPVLVQVQVQAQVQRVPVVERRAEQLVLKLVRSFGLA
jgi:hypothetical protein